MCGVTSTFHRNPGDGIIDVAEVVTTQFNFSRSDILLKPVYLRGSGNRNDPRFLSEQPRKRYLREVAFFRAAIFPSTSTRV